MVKPISRRTILLGGAFMAASPLSRLPEVVQAQEEALPPFASPVALPPIAERSDGPLRVVTSNSILADFAQQVGGERVIATSILPANADPHDFDPSPDDVIQLEDADLIILNGLQLDTWVEGLIESAQSDAPIVIASTGIETIGASDDEFEDGDPHVWFDPLRAIQMVANIRDGLIAIDPEGAAGYQQRFDAYAQQLNVLDAEIAARIATIPKDRRVLVTNHDALAYFANRYGLEIVGTVIPGLDSRSEPSAKEVAELIEKINEAGVTVIFAENTVGTALAESLAGDAGIRVAPELYTDSLGDANSGASTYIGLMQTDTNIIVENLLAG